MSTVIEISDDDDSIEVQEISKVPDTCSVRKANDSESSAYTSDEDQEVLPSSKKYISTFHTNQRNSAKMSADKTRSKSRKKTKANFTNHIKEKRNMMITQLFPKSDKKCIKTFNQPKNNNIQPEKGLTHKKMIGGVEVLLPVNPYGCQVALMAKVITAIKKSQNCLLESPTGTGKTLALLCAALAWHKMEREKVAQVEAEQYFSNHPELQEIDGSAELMKSSTQNCVTPEKLFNKTPFGEKSIYDKPVADQDITEAGTTSFFFQNNSATSQKRQTSSTTPNSTDADGLVNIHKKRRLNENSTENSYATPVQCTPEKNNEASVVRTPQKIRVPTIYYGARTHKQIEQVIKEFKRTAYCGDTTITILSSRDYSCIREFDKALWDSKNDMCRDCIKQKSLGRNNDESSCKFYDNRAALNHRTLPPVFDLEELVSEGREIGACPYFAARAMAASAHIVFCPYNYLIEPSIRASMQIDLSDNIVIIDEGHNIENICRDAASFTFTRHQILASMKELETLAEYRYSRSRDEDYVDNILKTLKSWDYWFENQKPLIMDKAVTNNEAMHPWNVNEFVDTLSNHDIGYTHYPEFHQNVTQFCQRLRDDPRTLFGVTQATGTLLESMDLVFGYMYRNARAYMDDFKPVLVRSVAHARSWRRSQFDKSVTSDELSLRVICLNPGVVFGALSGARCVLLASGTLTPLLSLHSELAARFPLAVSPRHNIPPDRVWVGTLSTCPDGRALTCTMRDTGLPQVQDALGAAIRAVCAATPHGVLCFLPSYHLLTQLCNRWKTTDLWQDLTDLKHVFVENRNVKDHNDIMHEYYEKVSTKKGALLFAVFRGKVSEGMDFKDQQARAVIIVGIPYPSRYDISVAEKLKYNDKYAASRGLLTGDVWLQVQAYRALNQAAGRCVRHARDWGAVLLLDARYRQPRATEHLSHWLKELLGNNHHTFDSLIDGDNGIATFMQSMKINDTEDNSLF